MIQIDKLVVGVGGLAVILFVAWFFFGKKTHAVTVEKQVRITVDGGYSPNALRVKLGQPVTLQFLRRDASSCLEEVVLPDFGVRQSLPLNQETAITITANQPGEFGFACGMNMYRGKILVEG